MENSQKKKGRGKLALQVDQMVIRIRELQGKPHCVALGMAIGVFVSITPTIPFHTVIAVGMAYLLKASRPAAIIGVWASNPFTVVFLYIACYKLGIVLFGNSLGDVETVRSLVTAMESGTPLQDQIHIFADFFHTRLQLFFAMIAGGVILGIPCGIITYFMTKNFVRQLHRKKQIKPQGTL